MNREQRRSMSKNGGDVPGELKYLQTPCTIAEAAQIARGVAEDVVHDYSTNENHLKIAMSLQIEILKEVVISAGLLTEEQFREKYMQRAEEFNRMQQAMLNQVAEDASKEETGTPTVADTAMDMQTDSIEVKTNS